MPREPDIPQGAGSITVHWLQKALGAANPADACPLAGIEIEPVETGAGLFGQHLRCHLTWTNRDASRPKTVFVKLHSSNPKTVRLARRLKLYRREYDYYRHLAPTAPIRSPALFWGGFEDRSHRFALVLEDMTGTHQEIERDAATPAEAKVAIRAAARLHAGYWDKVDDPRISPFPDYLKQYRRVVQLAYLACLPRALRQFGHCFSPDMRRTAESYGPRISDHLGEMGAGHRTFTHGDFRTANLFIGAGGRGCAAIDWQNCGIHSGLRDVSYFLSTSVEPELRREIEHEIVREYHDTLYGLGVKGYTFAECWRDYRRVMLSCLIGPVLTAGFLDFTDHANFRILETGWKRTLAAIAELDAVEFVPKRPRTFSVSNIFTGLSQGAYRAYKAVR